uniref:CSON009233 protein n=1 Tax=Culicoides sonorensis TaxID=179676 RepID=A0A336M2E4_CULSO
MDRNLAEIKETILQIPGRGIYSKRRLERINNLDELEDFCRRRKINMKQLHENTKKGNYEENRTFTNVDEEKIRESKKSKEKRRSKDKEGRSSKPKKPEYIKITGCSNVVIGTVNQIFAPITKTHRSSTTKPNMGT